MYSGVPLRDFVADPSAYANSGKHGMTVVVCRLGNDSQLAADALREHYDTVEGKSSEKIVDLIGGLKSWSKDVDSDFPIY